MAESGPHARRRRAVLRRVQFRYGTAGVPNTVSPGATSSSTTAPAPIRAPAPTVQPRVTIAPVPRNTSSPITQSPLTNTPGLNCTNSPTTESCCTAQPTLRWVWSPISTLVVSVTPVEDHHSSAEPHVRCRPKHGDGSHRPDSNRPRRDAAEFPANARVPDAECVPPGLSSSHVRSPSSGTPRRPTRSAGSLESSTNPRIRWISRDRVEQLPAVAAGSDDDDSLVVLSWVHR